MLFLLIFPVKSSRIVTDVDYLISGYFYYETRRATNALVHKDQAYEVYQSICQPRKVHKFITLEKKQLFSVLWSNNDLY